MISNLPIYKVSFDEFDPNDGIHCISLVQYPAMKSNFYKFEENRQIELKLDEDRHIIKGVVLRADFPIYRNMDGEEFYVVFDKDTITKLIYKFFKDGNNNKVNLQHEENSYVDSITMVESYQIDRASGVNPTEFALMEDGSWIVAYKVDNEELWSAIKKDESIFRGFSVETVLKFSEAVEPKQKEETFEEWYKNVCDSVLDNKNKNL